VKTILIRPGRKLNLASLVLPAERDEEIYPAGFSGHYQKRIPSITTRTRRDIKMDPVELNCIGLNCPRPMIEIAKLARKSPADTVVRILAESPTVLI
jgi:hypothetical protein